MDIGVSLEWANAAKDALSFAVQYGVGMTLNVRDESDVTRDEYSSIKSRVGAKTEYRLHAMDASLSPSGYDLRKSGLMDEADAMVYCPVLEWDQAGLALGDVEIHRSTVTLMGIRYEINKVNPYGWLGDRPVYYAMALKKR